MSGSNRMDEWMTIQLDGKGKPRDSSKSLPSVEQWPSVDVVTIHWCIGFEERSYCRDVDTEIAVRKGHAGLVVPLVELSGGDAPVRIVPERVVEPRRIDLAICHPGA